MTKTTREAKEHTEQVLHMSYRKEFRFNFSAPLVDLCSKKDATMKDINDVLVKQMDYIEHLLEKEEGKHIKIYRWLCGYFDFPIREEGDGAYYWRSHLRNKLKKIGISTLRNSKGGKQK